MFDQTNDEHPLQVDLNDRQDVLYWCRFWEVTESQLREAVLKVGMAAPAVAFALGKEAYMSVG